MENEKPQDNSSDEIDLGQLIIMIKNVLRFLFMRFLRGFIYFKRKAPILIGLSALGIIAGLVLNRVVVKGYKTEVILKPNLSSKAYLYDIVEELQAKIKSKDTVFFKSLGMEMKHLIGYRMAIEPIVPTEEASDPKIELQYMEVLSTFEYKGIVPEVIDTEILNKSKLNHRMNFYYSNAEKGQEYARKMISYINSNTFYVQLMKTYNANAKSRIVNNDSIIRQIDNLIESFSKKIGTSSGNQKFDGRIILDNEEKLDISKLFILKNDLISDKEAKNLELQRRKNPITIINFGKPFQERTPLFNNNIILLPLTLIGLFFLWSILKYLNIRAKKMVESNDELE